MLNMKMAGQVAIVTGAARGFGLAISSRLMECGVRVIGWDRDPSPIVADDRFLRVEQIDITCTNAVYAATESALSKTGQIDILINNAGIHGPQVPVEDYPLENWQRVIMVAWVASPACSYSTGACFDVSGGRAQF